VRHQAVVYILLSLSRQNSLCVLFVLICILIKTKLQPHHRVDKTYNDCDQNRSFNDPEICGRRMRVPTSEELALTSINALLNEHLKINYSHFYFSFDIFIYLISCSSCINRYENILSSSFTLRWELTFLVYSEGHMLRFIREKVTICQSKF